MPEKEDNLGPEEEKVDRITLQVSVQIIKHISSGLYRTPASAIKELISNAFDADAKNVNVKLVFGRSNTGEHQIKSVAVEDDGKGIGLDDIYYTFTHIGASLKSPKEGGPDQDLITEVLKRPVIGRLGIGILSIASACYKFSVKTKKEGDEKEYVTHIDLTYFEDMMNATETMEKLSIGNVEINSVNTGIKEGSYTKVEFSDFKPPFMESIDTDIEASYIFTHASAKTANEETYFREFLASAMEKDKMSKLHMLDIVALNLGLMSPVEYLSDGPVKSLIKLSDGTDYKIPGTDDKLYIELKERLKKFNFNVYLDVTVDWIREIRKTRFKLYKPLLYPLEEDFELNREEMHDLNPYVFTFGPVRADINDGKGNVNPTEINAYLYHQDVVLKPHEFRGILFRVHNVSIGSYFEDNLRLYSENPLILHQTMMEVYLDRGFQSIVNLDREGLYEGSNTFRHLKNFLENFLNGRIPERPVIKAVTPDQKAENLPSREFREKQEEEFIKVQKEVFKPHEGVIKNIRRQMREKRERKIRARSPFDVIEGEYEQKFRVPLKVRRLDEFDNQFAVEVKPDVAEAKIPRFEGTRAKLWDSLFLSALLILDYNDEKTKEFLNLLLKLYEVNEGRKLI